MLPREADTTLCFVRAGIPVAIAAVAVTQAEDGDQRAHADRLVRHWRDELVTLAGRPGLSTRSARPVRTALVGAARGLLVLSLAKLCDVTDEAELVRLTAALVLHADLPPGWRPWPSGHLDDAVLDDAVLDDALPENAPLGDGRSADAPPAGGPLGADEPPDLADAAASADEARAWALVARRIPATVLRPARELWPDDRAGQADHNRPWRRALDSLPALGGTVLAATYAHNRLAAAVYAELGLAADDSGATAGRVPGKVVAAYLAPRLTDARSQIPVPRGNPTGGFPIRVRAEPTRPPAADPGRWPDDA